MNIYKNIDRLLQERGMSRRQLAIAADIPPSTLQSALAREKNMTTDMLLKIATALEVTSGSLIGFGIDSVKANPFFWSADLEDKLKQIGYSTGFDEDNAILWINYPDGTLEVREENLEELHTSTNEYMRFKLEELKKKHTEDFRPQRGHSKS